MPDMQEREQQQNEDAMDIFLMSIRAAETKERYKQRFMYFCKNVLKTPQEVAYLGKRDPEALRDLIMKYIKFLRARVDRKEIRASSMAENIKPIKLFCEMNDITINWKKLKRLIPVDTTTNRDRAYTSEEIAKLFDAAKERGKAIILLLASSGMRVGALPMLKVSHVEPVHIDNKLVAGRVRVYADTKDEYVAFITRECYNAVQQYIEYRIRHGEKTAHGKINPESPLVRDALNTVNRQLREPRAVVARSLEDYLRRLCYSVGIKVKTGSRGELASAHGFRKFWNTTCKDAGMDPLHKELLLGHSTGLEDSYYRPQESKLLNSYLQVADKLTINDAEMLRVQNMELKQKLEKEQSFEERIKKLEESNSKLQEENAIFMKDWKSMTEQMQGKKRKDEDDDDDDNDNEL